MKFENVYRQGKKMLSQAGIEDPVFEASALFKKAFGFDRQQRIIHSGETAAASDTEKFFLMVRERASRRPLQYILGSWPFMGLSIKVGEGVLIPREETELLVNAAADFLKNNESARVIDLCSGSGAVALGIASLFPKAEIFAVEFYDKAFSYLKENIRELGFSNVMPVKVDVLNRSSTKFSWKADCITANPPYIKAEEIAQLQTEVRAEPKSALNGGNDGLMFYRAIAGIWLPKLSPRGMLAVEAGDGQADSVIKILNGGRGKNINTYIDFNGIERVVAMVPSVK